MHCVKSVVTQSFDKSQYEILVIDDGNTLSNCMHEKLSGMNGVLVHRKQHTGVCGTRNRGITSARGDYVVFIDQDCVARNDLLDRYREFLNVHPNCAAIGGQVLAFKPSGVVAKYCAFRGHLRTPIYNRFGDVRSVITANACFRKEDMLHVGMFAVELDDLQQSIGGEDEDISYRLLEEGFELGYCPDALVWHRHRDTLSEFIAQQLRNGRGLALHCFLRDRSLEELGLPEPGLLHGMLHMLTYLFLSSKDCPSVVKRTVGYMMASELTIVDKITFPCMDVLRRLCLIVGIRRARKLWDLARMNA